jgi:hypothetical protein
VSVVLEDQVEDALEEVCLLPHARVRIEMRRAACTRSLMSREDSMTGSTSPASFIIGAAMISATTARPWRVACSWVASTP